MNFINKIFYACVVILIQGVFFYNQCRGQEILKVVGYSRNSQRDNSSNPVIKAYHIKNNDGSFEKLTYRSKGICQFHETYDDSGFVMLHGIYVSYTKQGWVNEMGFYRSGQRSGQWYRRIGVFYYAVEIYENGKANATDSIYINPTVKNQAFISKKTNNGIVEASFPGGEMAYRKYLRDQLLQSRFVKTEEAFEPIVAFFVQATGTVTPVVVWQSHNFDVDFFARQMLQNIPRWEPAKEAITGKNVPILYFQRMAIYQN